MTLQDNYFALVNDPTMPEIGIVGKDGFMPLFQWLDGEWILGGGDIVWTFKVETVKLCDCGDDNIKLKDILDKAERLFGNDDEED